MLIKRRIKPRWEESARQEGEWGKVFGSVDFCFPSALSPVSGASRPWILSRLASSSHFQSGNKSGLYGPGGAHSHQCSPDGLWKAQITQRGHSSLRYFWSQHNSGGIGGLHSSMSSPPTHPLGPSASLHVWLSTGSTAISLFTCKKPWGLAVWTSLPIAATVFVPFSIVFNFVIMSVLLVPEIFATIAQTVLII